MRKTLITTVLLTALSIINLGCGGTYTITTRDIRGAIVSAATQGHIYVRERRLVIINNSELSLVIDFRGEPMILGAMRQVTLSFPLAGLLENSQSLRIPITITVKDDPDARGIMRTWVVYKSHDTSQSWLIQSYPRRSTTHLSITSSGY